MMSGRVKAGLFVLLAATSTTAADKPQPLPKTTQGDWVAVAVEFCGQRPPADIVRKYKVIVEADVIVLGPLNMADGKFNAEGEPCKARYEQNPKASPKAIDLILKDGDAEYRMLGIYAADGNQLKLCWQHDGKARPTEFKTNAEPTQMLLVLERAKP